MRQASLWRAIAIFLALTICLDAPFWVLVNATETVNAAYIFGMMSMPAIAAFLTCRILGRPVRSLGLGAWNGRFVLIAYLIPIAYCLIASLGTWLLFGGFSDGFAKLRPIVGHDVHRAASTTSMLRCRRPRAAGAAFWCRGAGCRSRAWPWSRGSWASWHYPIAGVVYRDADLPAWFWLLTFTFVAVAISVVQAWLRLRTDSVWPPIFLHASHNLWMQSIFFPLTTANDKTKWVAGDLGLAFVVVAAVVAVVFWAKRGELRPVDNFSGLGGDSASMSHGGIHQTRRRRDGRDRRLPGDCDVRHSDDWSQLA